MELDFLKVRKLDLLERLGGDRTYFAEMRDPIAFSREANKFYLAHILDSLDLKLSKLTSRSFGEELAKWDNKHLHRLVEALPQLMHTKNDKEKLQYLIEHNIKGDLHERFEARDSADRFSTYGRKVVQDLKDFGLNWEEWMRPAPTPKYFKSKNDQNPFILELKLWQRDFRREYAIGTISQCCISLDVDDDKQQYKPVLLDYFLDPAVQVSRVRHIDADGELERIGQIYMVPLVSLGKLNKKGKINDQEQYGVMLGVTSVEINEKYRNEIDIVPPLVNGILNEEGYREQFGFDKVLIGQRFNLVSDYFSSRKDEINNLRLRLKQLAQNKRQEKKDCTDDPESMGKITSILETLGQDLATIETLLKGFHPVTRLAVEKFGLRRTVWDDAYRGSNYFDILGKGNDGFINIDSSYQRAEGFYSGKQTEHRYMETNIQGIRNKYKKRN